MSVQLRPVHTSARQNQSRCGVNDPLANAVVSFSDWRRRTEQPWRRPAVRLVGLFARDGTGREIASAGPSCVIRSCSESAAGASSGERVLRLTWLAAAAAPSHRERRPATTQRCRHHYCAAFCLVLYRFHRRVCVSLNPLVWFSTEH